MFRILKKDEGACLPLDLDLLGGGPWRRNPSLSQVRHSEISLSVFGVGRDWGAERPAACIICLFSFVVLAMEPRACRSAPRASHLPLCYIPAQLFLVCLQGGIRSKGTPLGTQFSLPCESGVGDWAQVFIRRGRAVLFTCWAISQACFVVFCFCFYFSFHHRALSYK